MRRQGLPTYSMCRADGDMAVKRIAVAAHVATVTLEGPRALQKEFAEWVRSTYPGGAEMVALGQALVKCIRGMDLELLRMSRPQLDGIMQGMLDDLHAVLDSLGAPPSPPPGTGGPAPGRRAADNPQPLRLTGRGRGAQGPRCACGWAQ